MSPSSTSSGSLPSRAARQLAGALAKLRLDVGVAEPLVDLLLGRAAMHLAALGLGDPVLGDREPARDRVLAQLHVVRGGAGEVLEQVAEGIGGDDPQIDRDAVVGQRPNSVRSRRARCRDQRVGSKLLGERPADRRRWRSGRCPCRSRCGGGPSPRPRPGRRRDARAAPQQAPRRPAARRRAAAARPRPRRRPPSVRGPRGCSPRPSAPAPSARGSAAPRRRRGGRPGRRSPARRRAAAPSSPPGPGTRVTAIRVGGNFFFSFTAEGISPVSSRVTIFSCRVLPIPGSSIARPARASSSTETGDSRTVLAASW